MLPTEAWVRVGTGARVDGGLNTTATGEAAASLKCPVQLATLKGHIPGVAPSANFLSLTHSLEHLNTTCSPGAAEGGG